MNVPAGRLCCRGVTKSFPGVLALDAVDITVAPASVHAIVGENGAGKSTLMRILAGATISDAGDIYLDGEHMRFTDARRASLAGVSIVYQELNLVDDLSVAENVYLGRFPRKRWSGLVDRAALHRKAAALFDRLGLPLDVSQPVGSLTMARRQMVEIAKALSLDARVLILDEPSAVLTPHELESLFRVVREVVARGTSVLYISHRLDEVFEIADEVTVLRDGRHVLSRKIQDVSRNELITFMVGRPLHDEFPEQQRSIGDEILSVDALSRRNRFDNVTFGLRRGEVLALTGLVGSGRSSLAKSIFGAEPCDGGSVRVDRIEGPFCSPSEAMRAGVAMLPEDRKGEGLLLDSSIQENIALADLKGVARHGLVLTDKARARAESRIREMKIKSTGPAAVARTLSGGNQQKVLLGRWISRPHRVMILDEPTRGVDVGAKFEIYQLINSLAAEGVGVLMITSELPEAIGMADRIGVMHEGRLVGMLNNAERQVTQTAVMRLAAGEDSTS